MFDGVTFPTSQMNASSANLRYPTVPMPEASLVPLGAFAATPTIRLRRIVTLIGDSPDALIRLRSRSISERHAVVLRSNSGLVIRDLNSQSGVIVNGVRVSQSLLVKNDRLRIGKIEFRVEIEERGGLRNSIAADSAVLRFPSGIARAIKPPVFVIGRQLDCDLVLQSADVAASHASIFPVGNVWYVAHLCDHGQTKINGKAVEIAQLQDRDQIEVAGNSFSFEIISRDVIQGNTESLERLEPTQLNITANSPPTEATRHLGFNPSLANTAAHIPDWVSDAGGLAFAVARSGSPSTVFEPLDQPTSPRHRWRWIVALLSITVSTAALITWYALFHN